jgi:hypothetical protein
MSNQMTNHQLMTNSSRRDILRLGGLCGFHLSLGGLLANQAHAGEQPAVNRTQNGSFGAAKRIIMLYLHGGHPQQETFDPKPNGPSAVRGEFGAISTATAGVQFSELLPQTATISDKLAIVRSMSHTNPNHVTASLPAATGHAHPPGTPQTDFPPAESDFPPIGAVLSELRETSQLPSWVRIGPLMRRSNGTVLHGQLPGFLGASNSHFAVDQKLKQEDVTIQAVSPNDDLSAIRLRARRNLLQEFDQQRFLIDQHATTQNLDQHYQKAFSLLSSEATRGAFDLAAEPDVLRRTYGWTEFGQRCVLARRLIESGVPMVNVSYCHTPSGSWDTHSNNFNKMKESLAPTLDAALTGLVRDLEQRGLLNDTLVVVNAEFGRTPAINKRAGRDHWPWVYSLALAGAGTNAGAIHGSSDASAAYPASSPHSQADFVATIYHLLGIPADTVLKDQLGRPHQLILGQPIHELLA